jgi:hypothetical protein
VSFISANKIFEAPDSTAGGAGDKNWLTMFIKSNLSVSFSGRYCDITYMASLWAHSLNFGNELTRWWISPRKRRTPLPHSERPADPQPIKAHLRRRPLPPPGAAH